MTDKRILIGSRRADNSNVEVGCTILNVLENSGAVIGNKAELNARTNTLKII